MAKKRAYRTVWDGTASVVAARSRGQAVARTLAQIREAGYRATFTAVRAVRVPEFDGWAEVDESGVCWDEKYLPRD